MGKEDVAAAIEAMVSDDEVAGRLAGGDFTDLPEAELTDAETALVKAAAGDVPEVDDVVGFAKHTGGTRGKKAGFLLEIEGFQGVAPGSPFGKALSYTEVEWTY